MRDVFFILFQFVLDTKVGGPHGSRGSLTRARLPRGSGKRTRVCDAVPTQCPRSARPVPAQCPHSARCKFPLDSRMSRCQRIGGPCRPTSNVVWPFSIVIYSGHCAGTVRALSGHCAGIVRALFSA